MNRYSLAIAFPGSIVEVEPGPLRKTLKLGLIARSASIFGVDELIAYADRYTREDSLELIADVLGYAVIPPYLKKMVYGRKDTLSSVGALYPLQIPTHIVDSKLREGECREALVFEKRGRLFAHVGLEKPIELIHRSNSKRIKRGLHLVRIICIREGQVIGEIVEDPSICNNIYRGYRVKVYPDLVSLINDYRRDYVILATSRKGVYIKDVVEELRKRIRYKKKLLLLFGGPFEGLYEIAAYHNFDLDSNVDYVVNMVRHQFTKTIRTEEAILITLAILDYTLGITTYNSGP